MKKTLALAGLLCLTLNSLQLGAQARDWYDRWDRDHDHHWNWEEFRDANHDWYAHHRAEKALTDAELRAQFDGWDTAHNGWITREHVATFHHW